MNPDQPIEDTTIDTNKPFDEVAGSEYMIPFSEIDVEDQFEMSDMLMNLGVVNTDGTSDESGEVDLKGFAEFVRYLRANFVRDAEGFAKFARGAGAMERVIQLSVAYMGEMGKGAE